MRGDGVDVCHDICQSVPNAGFRREFCLPTEATVDTRLLSFQLGSQCLLRFRASIAVARSLGSARCIPQLLLFFVRSVEDPYGCDRGYNRPDDCTDSSTKQLQPPFSANW